MKNRTVQQVSVLAARDMEQTEAHLGRHFTEGERNAFTSGYLGGYTQAVADATRELDELDAAVTATTERMREVLAKEGFWKL